MAKTSFLSVTRSNGRQTTDPGMPFAIFLCLLYFVIFFRLSAIKYFSFQYNDWDLSLYANGMWNIIHGHPFITLTHTTFLGNHFTVIAFLIAPVYYVFRSPLTLIFLKVLSLSAAGLPIYLLGRKTFNWRIGLEFLLLYFLYPSLLYVTMFEFHFEDFSLFFLAWAFYFLAINRKMWFLSMSILAMLCKENVPSVVAMMGLYALLFRPRRRLIGAIVFAVATTYFLLVTLYLQPLFIPGKGLGYAAHYSAYGSDFLAVFRFILLHPGEVLLDLFSTARRLAFFGHMLYPLLYIPLLRPDILMITVPTVLKNLLSKSATTQMIFWHYTSTMIPFMLFSTMFAAKKLTRFYLVRRYLPYLLGGLLFIEISQNYDIAKSLPTRVKQHIGFVRDPSQLYTAKREAMKLIPREAGVIATFAFLPQLSQRNNVFTFLTTWKYDRDYSDDPAVDYAIIDFNDYFLEKDFVAIPRRISGILSDFTGSSNWGLYYYEGDIAVFKKGYVSPERLCKILPVPELPPENEPYLIVNDTLELLDMKTEKIRDENSIKLTFYWRNKRPSENLYDIFFYAFNGKESELLNKHSIGYRLFTPALGLDKILQEEYRLLLPEDPGPYEYTFSMKFGNAIERRITRMETSKKAKRDRSGNVIIGTFDNRPQKGDK